MSKDEVTPVPGGGGVDSTLTTGTATADVVLSSEDSVGFISSLEPLSALPSTTWPVHPPAGSALQTILDGLFGDKENISFDEANNFLSQQWPIRPENGLYLNSLGTSSLRFEHPPAVPEGTDGKTHAFTAADGRKVTLTEEKKPAPDGVGYVGAEIRDVNVDVKGGPAVVNLKMSDGKSSLLMEFDKAGKPISMRPPIDKIQLDKANNIAFYQENPSSPKIALPISADRFRAYQQEITHNRADLTQELTMAEPALAMRMPEVRAPGHPFSPSRSFSSLETPPPTWSATADVRGSRISGEVQASPTESTISPGRVVASPMRRVESDPLMEEAVTRPAVGPGGTGLVTPLGRGDGRSSRDESTREEGDMKEQLKNAIRREEWLRREIMKRKDGSIELSQSNALQSYAIERRRLTKELLGNNSPGDEKPTKGQAIYSEAVTVVIEEAAEQIILDAHRAQKEAGFFGRIFRPSAEAVKEKKAIAQVFNKMGMGEEFRQVEREIIESFSRTRTAARQPEEVSVDNPLVTAGVSAGKGSREPDASGVQMMDNPIHRVRFMVDSSSLGEPDVSRTRSSSSTSIGSLGEGEDIPVPGSVASAGVAPVGGGDTVSEASTMQTTTRRKPDGRPRVHFEEEGDLLGAGITGSLAEGAILGRKSSHERIVPPSFQPVMAENPVHGGGVRRGGKAASASDPATSTRGPGVTPLSVDGIVGAVQQTASTDSPTARGRSGSPSPTPGGRSPRSEEGKGKV